MREASRRQAGAEAGLLLVARGLARLAQADDFGTMGAPLRSAPTASWCAAGWPKGTRAEAKGTMATRAPRTFIFGASARNGGAKAVGYVGDARLVRVSAPFARAQGLTMAVLAALRRWLDALVAGGARGGRAKTASDVKLLLVRASVKKHYTLENFCLAMR